MMTVSFFRAGDFDEEVLPFLRLAVRDTLEYNEIESVSAVSDGNDIVSQLFRELAPKHPEITFSILMPNGENDDSFIDSSDIIICRKQHSNYLRSISKRFDLYAM